MSSQDDKSIKPPRGGGGRGLFLQSLASSSDDTPTTSSRARRLLLSMADNQEGSSNSSPRIPVGRGTPVTMYSDDSLFLKPSSSSDKGELTKELEKLAIVKPPSQTDEAAEPTAVIKKGKDGIPVTVETNFIHLSVKPECGVFEYDVDFDPPIHSQRIRSQLINQHLKKIGGTKTLDGPTLFLPIKLAKPITHFDSANNEDKYKIKVTFRRQKKMRECIQLYNILFDRIMKTLGFVRFQRKQFDPSLPKVIPQHKLEIWPGYVTAVDEYEGGVMLCLDISHRILTSVTVHQFMADLFMSKPGNFKQDATNLCLGSIVLTRYNNRTYRIDDIDFEKTPKDTFKVGDKEISYIEYYKQHYNINIRDMDQPLLISRKSMRISGQQEKTEMVLVLIPELCYLTGLTDSMRKDFKLMADVATHTRISPAQRMEGLRKFCENVSNCEQAMDILNQWGLKIDNKMFQLEARKIPLEYINFGKGISLLTERNADFTRIVTNNPCLEVVHLQKWAVLFTQRDSTCAKSFIDNMIKNSIPIGITVAPPEKVVLNDDHPKTYVETLRKIINGKPQIVVTICPTARDDRYAAIKKLCCVEMPCASQVINARTLKNETKNRSIVQKIALQMNCKLGGSLWNVKIPMKNVMIIGIDTYHEKMNNSVGGFVASLNPGFSRWYSKVVLQTKSEEFIHGLCIAMIGALKSYQAQNNGVLPQRIIIYRDGVSDGQLKMCSEYEIPQLIDACKAGNVNYEPKFTYIVVQKRVNVRIFKVEGRNLKNPEPGTILDHTITRKYLYDFFLVPQSVNQGTVTPSHLIVVRDDANFSPDVIQILSYKLCHMYYNWAGTVRVPACCQYAHKIAALVGTHIKRLPAEVFDDVLFYL